MAVTVDIPSTQAPLIAAAMTRKDGRIQNASTRTLRSMFNNGWVERDSPLSPNWSLTDRGRAAYSAWDRNRRESVKDRLYDADVVYRPDMSYDELKALLDKHRSDG